MLWTGSRILGKYVSTNRNLVEGKRVLEIGSGPGLAAFVAAMCGASSVVLSDYKRQVMELIAINIKAVKNQIENKKIEMFHAELDWYYGHEEKYLNELPILDQYMK